MRLILAILITLAIGQYIQMPQSKWMVLAAILGLQLGPGVWWWEKIVSLVVTGLLSAGLVFVSGVSSHEVVIVAVVLFIATGLLTGLGAFKWWGSTFTILFLGILSSGMPVTLANGGWRVASVLVGFGVAAILQGIIYPATTRRVFRESVIACLNSLRELSHAEFNCLLTRDYSTQQYLYEKTFHECRNQVLFDLKKLRHAITPPCKPIYHAVEHMYETLLSMNNIIYRIKDHSTFEVASSELLSIVTNLDAIYRALTLGVKKQKIISKEHLLEEPISALEEVNRNALRVVAEDPLVFTLFIRDLWAMNEELVVLTDAINAVGG